MSRGKDCSAPKRATMAISRGFPPVRISSARIVGGAGRFPDTLSQSAPHSSVSKGRRTDSWKTPRSGPSGSAIARKGPLALASSTIRSSARSDFASRRPASASCRSSSSMSRFSTTSTSRFSTRLESAAKPGGNPWRASGRPRPTAPFRASGAGAAARARAPGRRAAPGTPARTRRPPRPRSFPRRDRSGRNPPRVRGRGAARPPPAGAGTSCRCPAARSGSGASGPRFRRNSRAGPPYAGAPRRRRTRARARRTTPPARCR